MHAGVDGLLRDKTRPSRRPPLDRALIARVVELTASDPCGEATHWTGGDDGQDNRDQRQLGSAYLAAPTACSRLSKDPAFGAKLKDIAGLYVDPPAHAVVLSVDEKSQIQALDRTQPGLPMKRGRAGTMTHDYTPRHHHAVRRARRLGGKDHRPLHATPPPSGVHSLPQCHRGRGAGRQLRHPQTPEGQRMTHPASEVRLPLHPPLRARGSTPSRLSSPSSPAALETFLEVSNLRIIQFSPPPRRHRPATEPLKVLVKRASALPLQAQIANVSTWRGTCEGRPASCLQQG